MPISRVCPSCGTSHPQEEMTKLKPGVYICASCLAAKYRPCPDCGQVHDLEDFVAVETSAGEKKVCPKCAAKYKSCAVCGFMENVDDMVKMHSSSEYVCKTHEGYYAKSAISDKYETVSKMRAVVDEDGKIHYILREEFERSSGLSDLPWYSTVVNKSRLVGQTARGVGPVAKGTLYSCHTCGNIGIALKEVNWHWSRIDHTLRFLCGTCAHDRTVHDCGHVTSSPGTPSIRVPRIRSSIAALDADGCRPVSQGRESDSVGVSAEEGDNICPSCFQAYRDSLSGKNIAFILNYSFTPKPLVMHRLGEEKSPLMGFELEVDKGRGSNETAAKILLEVGRKHVYIKKDGSLGDNGFEQVTHPATIEYYLANRARYNKLLDIPRANGFKSHDAGTCGLHVHVDREFFPMAERNLGIRKVLFITEKFFPEIFIFSRRDADSATEWAHRWLSAMDGALICADQLESIFERGMGDSNRRKLVNLQKAPTMEFRIFRGTLNETTFWATLQLVHNIVSLAAVADKARLDALNWMDIIEFQHWPELSEYNAKRIGSGWDGKSRTKARAIRDASEAGPETVEIPDVIEHERIQAKDHLMLSETLPGFTAAWQKLIQLGLLKEPNVIISAENRGKFVLASKIPRAVLGPSTENANLLVRKDLTKEAAIHWLLLDADVKALVPESTDWDIIMEAVKATKSVIFREAI